MHILDSGKAFKVESTWATPALRLHSSFSHDTSLYVSFRPESGSFPSAVALNHRSEKEPVLNLPLFVMVSCNLRDQLRLNHSVAEIFPSGNSFHHHHGKLTIRPDSSLARVLLAYISAAIPWKFGLHLCEAD
jgi:hypothetical protein